MTIHEKMHHCNACLTTPGFLDPCKNHMEEYYLDVINDMKRQIRGVEIKIEEVISHLDFRKKQIGSIPKEHYFDSERES